MRRFQTSIYQRLTPVILKANSNRETRELDSGTIVSEEDDNLQNSSPSVPVDITALLTSFSRRSQYRIPTPFDELYPFPQVAPKSVVFLKPRTDHLMSSYALTEQEIKCRRKFKALKNMASQEIMDLVEDMRGIAWRHYELNNYHCEEVWLRRIITSSLKIPWHQPLEILCVCLWIIESLRLQCKYTSARSLHQDLHPKILKLVRSDHDLATCSRRILAKLTIGEYSQATAWREVLQICLLKFGPRHWETIECLSGLGIALLNDGQFQEAETINYIYLQLHHEPLNHANPLARSIFPHGSYSKVLVHTAKVRRLRKGVKCDRKFVRDMDWIQRSSQLGILHRKGQGFAISGAFP